MASSYTAPGVYIEEIASGVRTITGVATSITAFIGRALRGPVNDPVTISSYADYERRFGGLSNESTMSFAVRDFFRNGGGKAVVVRVYRRGTVESGTGASGAARFNLLDEAEQTEAGDAADAAIAAATTAAGAPGADAASVVAAIDALHTAFVNASSPAHRLGTVASILGAAEASAQLTGATAATVLSASQASRGPAIAQALAPAPDPLDPDDHRLQLDAVAPGRWSSQLRIRVDHNVRPGADGATFNLTVRDNATGSVEVFRNVSVATASPRRVDRVLQQESLLVRVPEGAVLPTGRPAATPAPTTARPADDDTARRPFEQGADGADITDAEILATDPPGGEAARRGIFALENLDLFNLLCIPPLTAETDVAANTWSTVAEYCRRRRAVLIIDPPQAWSRGEQARTGIAAIGVSGSHAAIYFPRIRQANPLRENQIEAFAPCGAVAGVIARTDATRGVWKAPAGLDARFTGVSGFSTNLTEAEVGELNPLGINCLRTMPAAGAVVWGARTREGDDRMASEWKYLPVRRTALFIEESLWRGTQWVVFEPNDEPLWAQIRLNLGAFMNGLFRQGAFQGATPREAYFVKCDRETTTQNDINLGYVNILVGFAPLKPAEFVVIRIQQIAGQIAT